LVDLQRTVYSHKWLHVSCRSSAGQGSLPTKYRRSATVLLNQPNVCGGGGSWKGKCSDSAPLRVGTNCFAGGLRLQPQSAETGDSTQRQPSTQRQDCCTAAAACANRTNAKMSPHCHRQRSSHRPYGPSNPQLLSQL